MKSIFLKDIINFHDININATLINSVGQKYASWIFWSVFIFIGNKRLFFDFYPSVVLLVHVRVRSSNPSGGPVNEERTAFESGYLAPPKRKKKVPDYLHVLEHCMYFRL